MGEELASFFVFSFGRKKKDEKSLPTKVDEEAPKLESGPIRREEKRYKWKEPPPT